MSEPMDCTSLKHRVERAVIEEIAPLLEMEGSTIEVLQVQDGVVQVRLHGSCTGCPSAIQAIILGLEEELRRRVPEIDYLEAVP